MAREFVEDLAYQAMERAVVNNRQAQLKQRREGRTRPAGDAGDQEDRNCDYCHAAEAVRTPDRTPRKAHLNGENHDYGCKPGNGNYGNQVAPAQDGTLQPNQCYSPGVMNHMKKKLTNNFEHYSNIFQGIALPVLFRRNRKSRSRSRSRSKSRDKSRKDRNHNRDHVKAEAEDRLSDEDDFVFVENIELRDMDALLLGSSSREVGRGHNFLAIQLKSPTWCDKCGDFIWGVIKQCLKCKNCQYTCHHKCRPQVTLDCTSVGGNGDRPSRNHSETCLSQEKPQADDADSGYHTGNNTLQSDTATQGKVPGTAASTAPTSAPAAPTPAPAPAAPPGERTLTREDLRRRIEAFNNNDHGLIMTLAQNDNTFQGFIRVHMNLIRPINMSISARPPSIYEVLAHEEPEEPDGSTEITSFYLPKGTTKVIHIDSDTTTQEVIRALLTKFRITDNPRKFALYEKFLVEGKRGTMRRLTDDMRPLPVCLEWSSEGLATRQLVLHENDTGEIMWEAFSIPELDNFLKILDREEEEYVEQVKAKYQLLKIQMNKRLKELDKERLAGQEDKRQPVFV